MRPIGTAQDSTRPISTADDSTRQMSTAQDCVRPISTARDSVRPISAEKGLGEDQRCTGYGFAVDRHRGQCVVKRPSISIAQVSAGRHRTKTQYGRLEISNAYDSKRGCFGTRARSRIEEDKVELTRAVAGQA